MLDIRALGSLQISENGKTISQIGSKKALGLMAFLAIEGGSHSREELATMLWPASNQEQASASLRVALSTLRKRLGQYIEADRDQVRLIWENDLYLDVIDLEKKIARGEVMPALKLYRGELLAGLAIDDSIEFENWRRWEQERIHLLVIEAMQRSLYLKWADGEIHNGQLLAAEIVKLDPLNELAFQQYMTFLALDGYRTRALKQYEEFQQRLADELGLDPTAETQQIRQVIAAGDLSTLSMTPFRKYNLPGQLTSLVGRELELKQVVELLTEDRCRLVTLTGPGGTGKSRLALETARRVLNAFADGVYFIQLEKIPSDAFLIPAIAESLNLNFDQITLTSDSKDQLFSFLSRCSCLLVMDGFEHIADKNFLLSEILERAPRVKILVTSRQVLNIQGEWVYQVGGLPIPESAGKHPQPDGSALDLFIERACQANPQLEPSDRDLESALLICRQVDGLPLGIELAAAWSQVLDWTEIASEIEKSSDFLKSTKLDAPERQRSLRSTFNYSWQLLTDLEKSLLAQLSVFSGGFSRQAAKRVTGASLMNLTGLLNKSLVRRQAHARLNMHRLIQQYAAEQLDQHPGDALDVQERHSRYFINFLQERQANLLNENIVATREEVRQEVDNLRNAVYWAVLHWDPLEALEVVRSFFVFYLVHGWHDGAIALDQLALVIRKDDAGTALDNPVYLSSRAHQAFFLSNLSMVDESELISQECLTPLKSHKLDRELSICLHNLGVNAEFRGEFDLSIRLLQKSIEIAEKEQFETYPSFYLWLGYVYFLVGCYEEGMQSFKASYSLFTDMGDFWASSYALSKMGLAADGLGQHADAMNYFREAWQIFTETGDVTGQAYSLSRMCIGSYFLEEYQDAIEYGEQAYKMFDDIGHQWGVSLSLNHLGFARLGQQQNDCALSTFWNGLTVAKDLEFTPLMLYSLAGISCVMLLEGKEEEAFGIFQYFWSHPRTPKIYRDIASRWFQDYPDLISEDVAIDANPGLLLDYVKLILDKCRKSESEV